MSKFALERHTSPLCCVLDDLHDHLTHRDGQAAHAEIVDLAASLDLVAPSDLRELLERVLTDADAAIERGDILGAEIMVDCARFERDSAAVEEAYRDAVTDRGPQHEF